jgi:hypothetical protein
MDSLKQKVNDYIQVKEQMKMLTEKKKLLETFICDTMNENKVNELILSDGSTLRYQLKENIKVEKEKVKKSNE